MSVIEANRLKMIDVMKILDNNLSDKTFVAGTSFSIGDIPLGIMVYRWLTLIKNRPAMTHLENWYNRLTERPSFKKNVLEIPLT